MTSGRPLSFALAFVWTFACATLIIAGLQLLTALSPSAALDIVQLGLIQVLVFVSVIYGVLRVHAPDRTLTDGLGMRPTHPALLIFGLALGLALQIPAGSLALLIEQVAPTPPEVLAERAALLTTDRPAELAVMILVSACALPFVEELFFRGALFGGLRREHSALGAALVTALCFALSRPDIRSWPALLLLGGALSHLRMTSGSVVPCVALHVGFGAAELLALLLGISGPSSPLSVPWWAIVLGWLVAGGLGAMIQTIALQSDQAAAARQEDAA